MDKSKPFGLIIPKRAKAFPSKSNALFDLDSDEETSKKPPTKIPQAKPLPKKLLEAETSEDPSIYEYDAIYDDMKAKEVAKIAPKSEDRPSRYIDSLLKAADKRKKNYERRLEKKVQSEREKEGDKFKDKEAFVTSAYKKKMQEMEEEEERERRENELNDMMDVTKQENLSGFYRHFLKQSVGEEKIPVFGERSIKKEPGSPKSHTEESNAEVHSPEKELDPNLDRDSDISLSDEEEDASKCIKEAQNEEQLSSGGEKEEPKSKKRKINRQIRKRFDDSDSASEKEIDEESKQKKRTKRKHSETLQYPKGDTEKEGDLQKRRSSERDDESDSNSNLSENTKLNDLANAEKLSKEDGESNEKKERKNIFEKRTVGSVFTEAQARYFQRMSARSS